MREICLLQRTPRCLTRAPAPRLRNSVASWSSRRRCSGTAPVHESRARLRPQGDARKGSERAAAPARTTAGSARLCSRLLLPQGHTVVACSCASPDSALPRAALRLSLRSARSSYPSSKPTRGCSRARVSRRSSCRCASPVLLHSEAWRKPARSLLPVLPARPLARCLRAAADGAPRPLAAAAAVSRRVSHPQLASDRGRASWRTTLQ